CVAELRGRSVGGERHRPAVELPRYGALGSKQRVGAGPHLVPNANGGARKACADDFIDAVPAQLAADPPRVQPIAYIVVSLREERQSPQGGYSSSPCGWRRVRHACLAKQRE